MLKFNRFFSGLSLFVLLAFIGGCSEKAEKASDSGHQAWQGQSQFEIDALQDKGINGSDVLVIPAANGQDQFSVVSVDHYGNQVLGHVKINIRSGIEELVFKKTNAVTPRINNGSGGYGLVVDKILSDSAQNILTVGHAQVKSKKLIFVSRFLYPVFELDSSFGKEGTAYLLADEKSEKVEFQSAKVLNDGKIALVVKNDHDRFEVVKLTAEGQMDQNYGKKGFLKVLESLKVSSGSYFDRSSIFLKKDGSIVVAVSSNDSIYRKGFTTEFPFVTVFASNAEGKFDKDSEHHIVVPSEFGPLSEVDSINEDADGSMMVVLHGFRRSRPDYQYTGWDAFSSVTRIAADGKSVQKIFERKTKHELPGGGRIYCGPTSENWTWVKSAQTLTNGKVMMQSECDTVAKDPFKRGFSLYDSDAKGSVFQVVNPDGSIDPTFGNGGNYAFGFEPGTQIYGTLQTIVSDDGTIYSWGIKMPVPQTEILQLEVDKQNEKGFWNQLGVWVYRN